MFRHPLIALSLLVLGSPTVQADVIVGYVSTNSMIGLPPTTVAPGVSGADLARGPGIVQNTGGTYNSRNWTIGGDLATAVANGDFLTFGFTNSGALPWNLTTLDIRYDRSGTGPSSIAIELSVNGGAFTTIYTDNAVSDTGETVPGIDLSAFTGVTSAVFRLAGWNATGDLGTFDIENAAPFGGQGIVVNGVGVPEPTTLMVLTLCAVGGMVGSRRWRRQPTV